MRFKPAGMGNLKARKPNFDLKTRVPKTGTQGTSVSQYFPTRSRSESSHRRHVKPYSNQ
jgi:hypothetical protein